jgi:hypothetical protein
VRVDSHVFDLSCNDGAVTIVDPTAPSYSVLAEAQLLAKWETLKREKHVLNGVTMIPVVMTSFGEFGHAAEGELQSLATIACSMGLVDWLCIAWQYLTCACVRCGGVLFRDS